MKIRNIIKGFTLIELLVVITIIGILATGATAVYTSQIQKARDSTRITDINALAAWIEQFYQDYWVYPYKDQAEVRAFSWWVTAYTPNIPQDPKSEQATTNTVFDYLYNVSDDSNTIENQEYELSTTFEQEWNLDTKADNNSDGWDDDERWERGLDLNDSIWTTWISSKETVVDLDTWLPVTIITLSCVTPVWVSVACSAAAADDPLVIKGNP